MGQSTSKKMKTSSKLSSSEDSHIMDCGDNKKDENNSETEIREESSNCLSANGYKQDKLQCLKANSNETISKDYKCKYELIKAVSTSAKLYTKNGVKRNCNLSIQTFRDDAVQYLLDVPSSNESELTVITQDPHDKINTIFSINKNLASSTYIGGSNETQRVNPDHNVDSDILRNPFLKPQKLADTQAVNDLIKNPTNSSMCSFCGNSLRGTSSSNTARTIIKNSWENHKKPFFYRCPICKHLVETKFHEKFATRTFDNSYIGCDVSNKPMSDITSSTMHFENSTHQIRTPQTCNFSDYSEITFSSQSIVIEDLSQSKKDFEEKSIMCELNCDDVLDRTVSRDTDNVVPASSILLLPYESQQQLPHKKWESILPKLVSMPSDKVLYVVEVNRSKPKSQNKSDKKSTKVNQEMGDTQTPRTHRIKNKHNQFPSRYHNVNYKSRNRDDPSYKILKNLEHRCCIKLNTLNDFLMLQPKYIISLLINGTLPKHKIEYKPVKIPLDYKKYTMFFSSGI